MRPEAQIKFGYGAGPEVPPREAETLFARLQGPDRMRQAFPTPPLRDVLRGVRALRALPEEDEDGQSRARRALNLTALEGLRALFARMADGDSAFRERLTWFWADHFTVAVAGPANRPTAPAYVDEAIRPHITGRFADMLKAVVTHPVMLRYLNQARSLGPNSRTGLRQRRGLNENLAREVLELHTLGVEGRYGQQDVRQLAELMTGLTFNLRHGFRFLAGMAEPGAETVLGRRYGGDDEARLEDIYAVMEDLALHPDTARHLARKLAVHFVADDPPEDLVRSLQDAYQRSGGALMPVYEALLTHPAALGHAGAKAKQPLDYIMSSLIALGAVPEHIAALSERDLRRGILRPAERMGQPLFRASGPDGWPEEAAYWITPQALATRIVWALGITTELSERLLDPDRVLVAALGPRASDELRFAVGAAETRTDAVALILASAEFNRR